MLVADPVSHDTWTLAGKIHAAIRSQLGRVAENISVDIEENVVTLLGTTASYYQRQLVIHAAQMAATDCRVVDEIQVAYPRRRFAGFAPSKP